MKRTLLGALVLACILVGCLDLDKDDGDVSTAEPASAEIYASRGISLGDYYDGLVCDWYTEGSALCADDTTFVYCTGGEWWALDCVDDLGADFCGYDEYDDTVDCYVY